MKTQRFGMGFLAALGMLILILDGKTALDGARDGIALCVRTVIPSLFPFFVLSMTITGTMTGMDVPGLSKIGRLFSLPSGAETILIPAFLGGYPAGAQCIGAAYQTNFLDKQDAERMLGYCNQAGPAFVFGMVAGQFPEKWMPWALWGIQIVSALCVSRILAPKNQNTLILLQEKSQFSGVMGSAVSAMAVLCGWVILFRVILAFGERWVLWAVPENWQVAILGFTELSIGSCALEAVKNVQLRFILCAGMLCWGGVCVMMQTVSAAKGLSIRYYLAGKAIQTALSLLFAAAIISGFGLAIPVCIALAWRLPGFRRKNSRNPEAVGV